MPLREGVLIGLGQPLLDVIKRVDTQFLEKYRLQPNDAIRGSVFHYALFNELYESSDVEFAAGGSIVNTLRAVQEIIKTPRICTMLGTIGDDKRGNTLLTSATDAGIKTHFQVVHSEPTGVCAVLLNGSNRSLCTLPGASNAMTDTFLTESRTVAMMKDAQYFYVSAFYLGAKPETVIQFAKFAKSKGARFMLNLGAPFIVTKHASEVQKLWQYVDVVFGNTEEARAFTNSLETGFSDDMEQILKLLSTFSVNTDEQQPRMAVITNGEKDVNLVVGSTIYPHVVPPIRESAIKTTNGAGDAFVAGFLVGYMQNWSLPLCVGAGISAGSKAIQGLPISI